MARGRTAPPWAHRGPDRALRAEQGAGVRGRRKPAERVRRRDPKGLAALTVAKDDPGDGSSLDVFDPSNPFKPPQDIIANSDDATTGPTTGSTGDTAARPAPATASTPPATARRHRIDRRHEAHAVDKKTTTAYRYVIDATFTANGEKRKIDGMDPLDVLPSHSNALIVFLGVRPKGGNAVFILDKTLYASATGDGKCKPKQDQCGFLFLQPGAKETFTTEAGDTYVLKVRAIRKVKLRSKSLTAKKKASADGDDATGATAESAARPSTRSSRSSSRTSTVAFPAGPMRDDEARRPGAAADDGQSTAYRSSSSEPGVLTPRK